jgi:hypothetical protein
VHVKVINEIYNIKIMKYQDYIPFWYIKEDQMSKMSYEDERKYTKRALWIIFIFAIVSIIFVEFVKYL